MELSFARSLSTGALVSVLTACLAAAIPAQAQAPVTFEGKTIIKSHSPCLIGNNAEARKTAVSLVGDDEGEVKYVVNVVVDLDPNWVAQCEREAIGDAVLNFPPAERKAS